MKKHKNQFSIGKMAKIMKFSRRGYPSYEKRVPSNRKQENLQLEEKIKEIHKAKRKEKRGKTHASQWD